MQEKKCATLKGQGENACIRFTLVSLGCDKNLVDAEYMVGLLCDHGFRYTEDESEADVIVVNTCCFIHDAKQESIETILRLTEYKRSTCKRLIVTGCLAQRYSKDIQKEIPEVDAVLGTASYDDILTVCSDLLGENAVSEIMKPLTYLPSIEGKRVISTPGHYEYLKIAEGCDKHCTYCIIPHIRGPYRSYPMEELLKKAEFLAKEGVSELIVIAQETTVYGVDLYGRKMLPTLLSKLSEIEGIRWIRLLYAYPEEIDDELIEVMSTNPKVLHYIDMPIQHSVSGVLKRMGRRTDEEQIRAVIRKLRERIPDICIRTTLITGFPGETEEDYESLYRFVNEIEFDRLGVFTYSREEDTPAAKMSDQVPERTKKKRYRELMELQQAIVFDNASSHIGESLEVIVEGELPNEEEDGHAYVCRTYRDAPDIDGFIFVNSPYELMTGQMFSVRVSAVHDYDLIGEMIDEDEHS